MLRFFRICFPKGKCVVPGLSDFFKKRNVVFGVRVGNSSAAFSVSGAGNGLGDAGRLYECSE